MTKKIVLSTFIAAFVIISCGPGPNDGYVQPVYYGPAIGLGSIIAVVIS